MTTARICQKEEEKKSQKKSEMIKGNDECNQFGGCLCIVWFMLDAWKQEPFDKKP